MKFIKSINLHDIFNSSEDYLGSIVYEIQNRVTQEKYIGSTTSSIKRVFVSKSNSHLKLLHTSDKKLYQSIRQYGEKSFDVKLYRSTNILIDVYLLILKYDTVNKGLNYKCPDVDLLNENYLGDDRRSVLRIKNELINRGLEFNEYNWNKIRFLIISKYRLDPQDTPLYSDLDNYSELLDLTDYSPTKSVYRFSKMIKYHIDVILDELKNDNHSLNRETWNQYSTLCIKKHSLDPDLCIDYDTLMRDYSIFLLINQDS
jgi:hypothetical protein